MHSIDHTVRLDLPASYAYLSLVGSCLAAIVEQVDNLPEAEQTLYAIQLAVHETCANIIEHAYAEQRGGRVQIIITRDMLRRRLVVDIYDTGRPFDIQRVAPPDLETPQEGGYGLFLIQSLMDELVYVPQPSGNRWRLVKHLH
jgi:serine/threonine-protein kinase RsbW